MWKSLTPVSYGKVAIYAVRKGKYSQWISVAQWDDFGINEVTYNEVLRDNLGSHYGHLMGHTLLSFSSN